MGDSKKLVANILAIAEAAAKKIPRSWANIQMIGVKTADSVTLPVYNKTPEALREIANLAGLKTKEGGKTEEKAKSESDKKESKEKKKKDLKSPLLQALKKQKEAEAEKKPSKRTKKEE